MNKLKTITEIKEAASKSYSVAETMSRLGYAVINGGSHTYFSKKLSKLGIDTSHFLGRGRNRGPTHTGGPRKLSSEDILVYGRNGLLKENIPRLRRAMTEAGLKYECNVCKIPPVWNGAPLVLEIDHINGCSIDNTKSNLQFICSNCHTQKTKKQSLAAVLKR